jgi:hypothetical protein
MLGNLRRYNPMQPKIRGIKNAPKPKPLVIIILARKCPLFPAQFLTAISGPETISESAMLRSVFHQKRYATQASRRYKAILFTGIFLLFIHLGVKYFSKQLSFFKRNPKVIILSLTQNADK